MKETAMKKMHRSLFAGAGVLALLALRPAPAQAQVNIQFRLGGPDRPLQGRNFQQMRALAHYLDEQAWEASNVANEQVAYSERTRQVIAMINDFAQRASDFHERVDTYQTNPWDLRREVASLDDAARRVSYSIRRARVYSNVVDQWNDVVEAMNRMKSVLNGRDVVIPPPHRRGSDYERDYGAFVGGSAQEQRPQAPYEAGNYQPGYSQAQQPRALSGRELDEFRNLARDLDATVARALETTERYRGRGGFDENLYAGLKQMNNEVSSLWQNVDQEQVDAARWTPTIQRLQNDARNFVSSMTSSGTMSGAVPQMQHASQDLDRMAQILR
jgi:hypothetical protein